jgi:hypothetical protein
MTGLTVASVSQQLLQRTSGKGKERAQASSELGSEPLLAAIAALGPPRPSHEHRPTPRRGARHDVASSFVEDNVALASVPQMSGLLPGAIEHAHAAALQGPSRTVDGLTWTARWRPVRAAECLGNELTAQYLCDWLHELQVTPWHQSKAENGHKRPALSLGASAADTGTGSSPRKKRAIEKRVVKPKKSAASRRRRAGGSHGYGPGNEDDEMDDFIVDDEEAEEAFFDRFRPKPYQSDSEDELMALGAKTAAAATPDALRAAIAGVSRPRLDLGASSASSPAFSSTPLPEVVDAPSWAQSEQQERFADAPHLRNCIVLVGPSGVGKTAAAYACAAELGFEVFELYPGMKRRSGKDVESAVGALGKNHMVGAGGSGGGAGSGRPAHALAALMRGAAATESASCEQTKVAAAKQAQARQSLILLEEVDVLYEEDKGFWSAVIELAADSRRPLVLTCNGEDSLQQHRRRL